MHFIYLNHVLNDEINTKTQLIPAKRAGTVSQRSWFESMQALNFQAFLRNYMS